MSLPNLSLLDVILAVIVGISVIAGFAAGFARVGIGFCAAIAGLLFGFWFYGIPAAWIHRYISSTTVSNMFGFLLIFMGFIVAGSLIAKIVSRFFKFTGLSWLDRLLGGAFGFVRGSFIGVAFVAVLLAFTPKPLPNWMVNSKLLPYAVEASDVFASLAPKVVKDAFHEGLDEIRREWDEQLKKNLPRKQDQNPKKAVI